MSRQHSIKICLGSSCFSRGNRELVNYIREYLKKTHLDERVTFKGSRCFDQCSKGPVLVINGHTFYNITIKEIDALLEKELESLK